LRTDLDRVCLSCLSRTASVAACPSCGRALADLRDDEVRKGAMQRLERRAAELEREWRAKRDRLQRSGFVQGDELDRANHTMFWLGLLLAGISIPLLWLGVPLWIAGGGPLAAVLAAGWHLRRRLRRLPASLAPRVPVNLLLPPAPFDAAGVRGRVRRRRLLVSPVGERECVAFRLVGRIGSFDVDDAAGVDFDVVRDDGRSMPVSLDHAVLQLPSGERVPVGRHRPLVEFARQRGLPSGRPEAELAESVLLDGDEVIVIGTVDRVAEPDGYRETRWVETLRGTPDSPVIVLPIDPDRPEGG
jgi:hypothetical protein